MLEQLDGVAEVGVTVAQACGGAGLHHEDLHALLRGVTLAQAYAGAGLHLVNQHALGIGVTLYFFFNKCKLLY